MSYYWISFSDVKLLIITACIRSMRLNIHSVESKETPSFGETPSIYYGFTDIGLHVEYNDWLS